MHLISMTRGVNHQHNVIAACGAVAQPDSLRKGLGNRLPFHRVCSLQKHW